LSQRTHVCDVQLDSVSDASRLLDLGGLAVERIELDTFGGREVHRVTADETAACVASCPRWPARLRSTGPPSLWGCLRSVFVWPSVS
jgi:hypothetical protein